MVDECEIIRHECNSCSRQTKHKLLLRRETTDEDEIEDYGPISWQDTYELLECLGCETVCLKHTNYFDPTREETVSTYPPRTARRKPLWLHQTPGQLIQLLQEVYQALDGGSRALALMGARAIIDMVMQDTVGNQGTFSARLDALENAGHIGSRNKDVLRAALEAGSAASHRGFRPSANDLNAVMDIVENLVQSVYHLKKLAESLAAKTPSR
jgi:hypothetical protein